MSHHAHNRVRPRTVRPLGVRPQKLFVLTTDEHRWTQIFRCVAKLSPSRRGGNPLAWHFVGRPKGGIICVYLCPSVVESISCCTPRKALDFAHQNPRKPQQNPTSSSLVNPKFFWRQSAGRHIRASFCHANTYALHRSTLLVFVGFLDHLCVSASLRL